MRLSLKHWRSRWMYTHEGRVLHRVSSVQRWWPGEKWIHGDVTMVCGVRGHAYMPGLFSRMGLDRCKKCEKAMGLAHGHGNPWNYGVNA